MESQHRAVLSSVNSLLEPEAIATRDRAELVETCRNLADWLRQYVEICAEQSAEIQRLTLLHQVYEGRLEEQRQGLKSKTA